MPVVTVGKQHIQTQPHQRLVLALEDAGIPILHRCGGFAKCTTCRVRFAAGEPTQMTEAEKIRLSSQEGLSGNIRLSCQILCQEDMTLEPLITLPLADVEDAGQRPQDGITPEPIWLEKD